MNCVQIYRHLSEWISCEFALNIISKINCQLNSFFSCSLSCAPEKFKYLPKIPSRRNWRPSAGSVLEQRDLHGTRATDKYLWAEEVDGNRTTNIEQQRRSFLCSSSNTTIWLGNLWRKAPGKYFHYINPTTTKKFIHNINFVYQELRVFL